MNIVLISTNCAHFKHYKSLTIISFYKADNEKNQVQWNIPKSVHACPGK